MDSKRLSYRDARIGLETFFQDLRQSVRGFASIPGFTAIAVIMLALGIGVNTAIFTLLNTIVLRPLPLPNADRLVVVLEQVAGEGESPPSWLDQRDLREQNHVLESVGAFAYDQGFLLRVGGETRHVDGARVTADYFATLGVMPIAGRLFDASEMEAGRDNVVLLREDYWRTNLNSDPSIFEKQIELNGRKCNVIGILPAWFRYPWETGVIWTPLAPSDMQRSRRGWHGFPMIGRLKPGISLERARADIDGIVRRLAKQYPDDDRDRNALLVPAREWYVNSSSSSLYVLQCAALALFLMTCANVSSLLLARYSTRRREFAIRSALGASRWRQLRRHLTESLFLAGFGCICGIGIAYCGVSMFVRIHGSSLPRTAEISIDPRLILFTVGTTVLGAIVFGLATAFHERSRELNKALAEGGRSGSSRRGVMLRKCLVSAQVMFAMILVAGAGELIRSYQRLLEVDAGIKTSDLLTVSVALPATQYTDTHRIASFYERALNRIRELPGVESAGSINLLPVQAVGYNGDVSVAGLPPHSSSFFAEFRWIGGDYFRTMGIPIVRGRHFLPEERSGKRRAIIINETMARALWGDRDPLGSVIEYDAGFTVVGVARDVRQTGLEVPPRAEMFMPLATLATPITTQSVVVRSRLSVDQLVTLVRQEIRRVDEQASVYRVKTMRQVLTDSISYSLTTTTLLSLFATLALVLAGCGLYGVMSFVVAERRREFAIRAALGANPATIAGLVFRQSLMMVAIGVGLGIGGVAIVSRALPALLYGVDKLDAGTLAAAITVLTASAIVAVAVPALRMLRIDPIQALRQE